MGCGVEQHDQDDRHHREEQDAVAVGEPVAARAELAGGEAVLGQDRAEHREAVERRVRGEHQDDAGHRDDEVEAGREAAEDGVRDLRDHHALVEAVRHRLPGRGLQPVDLVRVDVLQPHLLGQHDDADHHRDRDQAEQQQRRGRVAATSACGTRARRWRSPRHRSARHSPRRTPGPAGRSGAIVVSGSSQPSCGRIVEVARSRRPAASPANMRRKPHRHMPRIATMNRYVGTAKNVPDSRTPRRFSAASTATSDHRHGDLVVLEGRDRRGGVLRARGDRHRDGQHVVDEQCARHGHPRPAAEVDGGHLVVATAGGVGVHGLPVRRDHGQHHHGDGERDLPGPGVGGDAGHAQHDEDLVRRVGDRGERVAGEDRQGDPLG